MIIKSDQGCCLSHFPLAPIWFALSNLDSVRLERHSSQLADSKANLCHWGRNVWNSYMQVSCLQQLSRQQSSPLSPLSPLSPGKMCFDPSGRYPYLQTVMHTTFLFSGHLPKVRLFFITSSDGDLCWNTECIEFQAAGNISTLRVLSLCITMLLCLQTSYSGMQNMKIFLQYLFILSRQKYITFKLFVIHFNMVCWFTSSLRNKVCREILVDFY